MSIKSITPRLIERGWSFLLFHPASFYLLSTFTGVLQNYCYQLLQPELFKSLIVWKLELSYKRIQTKRHVPKTTERLKVRSNSIQQKTLRLQYNYHDTKEIDMPYEMKCRLTLRVVCVCVSCDKECYFTTRSIRVCVTECDI